MEKSSNVDEQKRAEAAKKMAAAAEKLANAQQKRTEAQKAMAQTSPGKPTSNSEAGTATTKDVGSQKDVKSQEDGSNDGATVVVNNVQGDAQAAAERKAWYSERKQAIAKLQAEVVDLIPTRDEFGNLVHQVRHTNSLEW